MKVLTHHLALLAALLSVARSTPLKERSAKSAANSVRRTWKTLAPIADYPRQEHVTVALSDSTIAVLGGIIPPDPASNNSIPFETTGLLQLYDIPTNTWRTASPAPIALNHPNAAALDNKLYLLGGLADRGTGAWQADPRSFVYDPASDSWAPLPPIPESEVPRGSAAMGVDQARGRIYLAGGMTELPVLPGSGPRQESVDAVSAFDARANRWVTGITGRSGLPAAARRMPGRRDHAGGAVVDGVLYVLGGRDRGQTNVRGDVFALALDEAGLRKGWTAKRASMPTPRGGVAAAEVKGNVYVIGGEGNPEEGTDGVFDDAEVYDVRRDRWERLAPMQTPRHGTSAVSVGGGVYIPGGGVRQGGAPVDVFDVFWP